MLDETPEILYTPSTSPCFSMKEVHWINTSGTSLPVDMTRSFKSIPNTLENWGDDSTFLFLWIKEQHFYLVFLQNNSSFFYPIKSNLFIIFFISPWKFNTSEEIGESCGGFDPSSMRTWGWVIVRIRKIKWAFVWFSIWLFNCSSIIFFLCSNFLILAIWDWRKWNSW